MTRPGASETELLEVWGAELDAQRGAGSYRSLLEVGCGRGETLRLARSRGWDVFGVESDPERRGALVRDLDLAASVAPRTSDLVPNPFDAVLLSHPGTREELEAELVTLACLGGLTPRTRVLLRGAGETEKCRRVLGDLGFPRVEVRGEALEAQGSSLADFLKERYLPGAWGMLGAAEHLPRYRWARSLCHSQRVLDLGCGTGYGSRMVAAVAASVTGLDRSPEALAWARRGGVPENLEFREAADLGASLEAGSFDRVLAFELLEHLGEANQGDLMTQVRRLLAPGGLFLVSTPDPRATARYGDNPHHLLERDRDSFLGLVESHFEHVLLLEQRLEARVSLTPLPRAGGEAGDLAPPGSVEGPGAPQDSGEEGPVPLVWLAVASRDPLPRLPGWSDSLGGMDLAASWLDRERELARLRQENHVLRQQLLGARTRGGGPASGETSSRLLRWWRGR